MSEEIMRHVVFIWRNHDTLASLLLQKNWWTSFVPQGIRCLIISWEKNEVPQYFFSTKSSAALFLQTKKLIFLWRNNESPHFFWRNNKALHFCLKNSWSTSFFSKEIMRHFIFFSRNNEELHFFWRNNEELHFFSEEIMRRFIFSKEIMRCFIFSEEIMRHVIFIWRNNDALASLLLQKNWSTCSSKNQTPHYFLRNKWSASSFLQHKI